MGALTSDDLRKEGYELARQVEAALPMSVWAVDLEIERPRLVSAAELAILKLAESGVSEVAGLTTLLGMGTDARLAERVLVKMLGAGAIEPDGVGGFALTPTGQAWKAEGSALGRERVSYEIRLDPIRDALEWVDQERPVFSTGETWTIALPGVNDDVPLRRRAEIAELLHVDGLPDDEEKAPRERRGAVELRGIATTSRRVHWREVGIDVFVHPIWRDVRLVGHIGGAENPSLTQLLAHHSLHEHRKRVAVGTAVAA